MDAARKVFQKVGPVHATMDMISKELEIGRTTLYLHFRNKDEIMAKILTGWYRELRANIESVDSASSSLDQMRFMLKEYLNYCLSHPDEYFIHRSVESSMQKENISRKILKELEDERKKRIDLMEIIYNRAREEGLVDDLPVYFLVGAAWGMLRGVIDVIIENHFAKEISDKEKFFQFVEKVFFYGILLKENTNEIKRKKNSYRKP